MNADEIMSFPVQTVRADATVVDAANIMLDRNISALPVVNDRDHLVGIMSHSNFFLHPIRDPGMHGTVFELFGKVVTEGNLNRLAEMLAQVPVSTVMSTPVVTIQEDTHIEDIVRIMEQRRLKRLPVVRGDEIVGMVTRHDFLRFATTGGHS